MNKKKAKKIFCSISLVLIFLGVSILIPASISFKSLHIRLDQNKVNGYAINSFDSTVQDALSQPEQNIPPADTTEAIPKTPIPPKEEPVPPIQDIQKVPEKLNQPDQQDMILHHEEFISPVQETKVTEQLPLPIEIPIWSVQDTPLAETYISQINPSPKKIAPESDDLPVYDEATNTEETPPDTTTEAGSTSSGSTSVTAAASESTTTTNISVLELSTVTTDDNQDNDTGNTVEIAGIQELPFTGLDSNLIGLGASLLTIGVVMAIFLILSSRNDNDKIKYEARHLNEPRHLAVK